MQRTISTCLVSLIVGILCGMFIYLGLSIDAIMEVLSSAAPYTTVIDLGAVLFEGSITPITSFSAGRYAPIAVLARGFSLTDFLTGKYGDYQGLTDKSLDKLRDRIAPATACVPTRRQHDKSGRDRHQDGQSEQYYHACSCV